MLEFNLSDLESDKQSRTTQIRHGEKLGDLISAAATALGVDKSVFLRGAIEREARRVLEANSRHVLTRDDAAQFSAALDAAPEPTPRARAAAEEYRRKVIHAD